MSRAQRRMVATALAAVLALSLAACGKKGNLEPVDPERQVYPRTYPAR